MRVSTSLVFNQSVQNILGQQSKLVNTQNQLAAGTKILAPSDDPGAASRILDLNEAIAQITQHEENAVYATQRLGLEETTLDSVGNILQRIREIAVQAGNSAVYDSIPRQAMASEIRELQDEILDLANVKDANGEYIFAGFQSGVQPFTSDGLGNFTYNGDQGQLAIQIGSNRQVVANDSGAEVFQLIRNGNGDFSTDANTANTGYGVISTGSVQNPGAFLNNDYTIRFTSPTTFEVDNNTTGAVNIIGAQTYSDGGSITFDGIEVNISGSPATGDTFTVNTSRNQDVFTTIQQLLTTVESAATANGNYDQGIGNALNNIDRVLDNIVDVRTSVGSRLNSIDSQADDNAARMLQL